MTKSTTGGGAALRWHTPDGQVELDVGSLPDGFEKAKILESGALPCDSLAWTVPGYQLAYRFDRTTTRVILGRAAANDTLALDTRTDGLRLESGDAVHCRQTIALTPAQK